MAARPNLLTSRFPDGINQRIIREKLKQLRLPTTNIGKALVGVVALALLMLIYLFSRSTSQSPSAILPWGHDRLVRDAAELQLCRIDLERMRREGGGLADLNKCQDRLVRLTGTGTITNPNGTAPAPFEDVDGMSAADLKKEVINLRRGTGGKGTKTNGEWDPKPLSQI
ncbi:hypothetical protein CLOM_g1703 [Closterium sp. NIES-68]|nr:hypothetical protein CLOM_g1703 [Closterium sp. NIES-68]